MTKKYPNNILKIKNKNQRAFTLVEMLVTIFILLILIFSVSGIYLYSLRTQQKTVQLNLVAQDVQFVMDVLTKKIRSSEIDYSYYGGTINSSNNKLALAREDGGEVYKKIGKEIGICPCSGSCYNLCAVESDFISLTTSRLKVVDLKFYINPDHSPFGEIDLEQIKQPRVTVLMKVQGAGAEFVIQQTAPQRFFERR